MGKLLDRLLKNTPEDRAKRTQRELAEKDAKKKAIAAELRGYREGLIKGAEKKGKEKGFKKGSGQGGTLSRIGAGLEALERGAGKFSSGMELENVGSGLGSGSAFGFNFGSEKKKKSGKKTRTRVVYVERVPVKKRRRK